MKLKKGRTDKLDSFNEEEVTALLTLLEKLMTLPVLQFPRKEGKLIFDTEACDGKVGCVLLQKNQKVQNGRSDIGHALS